MKIRRWGDVKLDTHGRAPRTERGGMDALEGDVFNNRTVEVRAERWLETLENAGLISSPTGRFTILRGHTSDDDETMVIAGRNTIDKVAVFTCTFCPKPTTENPGKRMRGVWPPPENWSGAVIRPDKVPKKLKKYKWEMLVCDECAEHAEKVLVEKAAREAGDEPPPVQD